MKKNRMMRLASILLVLTLISTCAISGTFAKYVTEVSGTDEARVAYWGFNQAAWTSFDLFDATYDNGNVKSQDGKNILAPGTSKTTTFSFGYANGQKDNSATPKDLAAPEVKYEFKVEATSTGTTTDLDKNVNFKWTLQKGSSVATEYSTVAALLAAIEALSGDASGTKTYDAGALPTNFTSANEVYTVGWKWDYGIDDTDQDKADTALGNAASLENVSITITITATQLD